MKQTRGMIADCLSSIVCQDTAKDDETLNLHVTALMTFQDGNYKIFIVKPYWIHNWLN